MKHRNLHILLLAALLLTIMASCHDDDLYTPSAEDGTVLLQLQLVMPDVTASRASTPTDEGTIDERRIADGDIYVVMMNESEKVEERKILAIYDDFTLLASADRTLYTISKRIPMPGQKVCFRVLANVKQSGITTDLAKWLENQTGTVTEYSLDTDILNITMPESGKWLLTENSGYIPMQSAVTTPVEITADYTTTIPMYRCLAKVGVQLCDEAKSQFSIEQVVIYNQYEKTCFVNTNTPNAAAEKQFTSPYLINSNRAQRTQDDDGMVAYLTSDSQKAEMIEGIYVPEHDTNTSYRRLIMMVGGYRKSVTDATGEKKLEWYRIDFTDDCRYAGNRFSVVRNHWYIFEIESVNGPGIDAPDPTQETSNLSVIVSDYIGVPMGGISGNYTLEVDASTFNFEGLVVNPLDLHVWSFNSDWSLLLETDPALIEAAGTGEDGWLKITDAAPGNHSNIGDVVEIQPEANLTSGAREGYFYITDGAITKKIYVYQQQAETANSYIVSSPGTYVLKTDVRGNGNKWAWGDDSGDETVDVSFDLPDKEGDTSGLSTIPGVEYCKIIWETSKGLVTLIDDINDDVKKNGINQTTGCMEYEVHDVTDQWGSSVFATGHGGNALIGAFDKNDILLWSWHIWVVADFADGVKTETWVTGVKFIDRYLGAFDNQPGSRSFGLLYQWGRKDPFIGPVRDERERNFYEVKKARTYHYLQKSGQKYVWDDWGENGTSGIEESVAAAIQHPTTLMTGGFLSENHKSDHYKGMWGSKSANINAKDNGCKTMWDPCPPGYRVPSVHSFNFSYNSSINVFTNNWRYNMEFVPYTLGSMQWEGRQGDNDYTNAYFYSDAPDYGFWIDYTIHYDFNYSGVHPVIPYGQPNEGHISGANRPLTWMPIAGIYNGTTKFFGTCGTYSQFGNYYMHGASSIHMNNVIWLNAPNAFDNSRPAGLFQHGCEGSYVPSSGIVNGMQNNRLSGYEVEWRANGNNGGDWALENGSSDTYVWKENGQSIGDWWQINQFTPGDAIAKIEKPGDFYDFTFSTGWGRHWHRLNDNNENGDLMAHPNWAGSIRPVSDKDFVDVNQIIITSEMFNLWTNYGASMTIKISAAESWQISHPGAKWMKIEPDHGGAGETAVTFSYDSSYGLSQGTYTVNPVVKFAFGNERTLTVNLYVQ